MKKVYFISLSLLLLSISSYAQRTCGSELNLSAIQQNDPERYSRILEIEQQTQHFIKQKSVFSTMSHGGLHVTIPVVVHVLHQGEAIGSGLNISMPQIQSQIDVLNEDFRRLNADASNTPGTFTGVVADVGIEFVLACVDPDGYPSDGIIRHSIFKFC